MQILPAPIMRIKASASLFTYILLALFFTGMSFTSSAQTDEAQVEFSIETIKADLGSLESSPQLIDEINAVIDALEPDTPVTTRIELDLWKLDVLTKISTEQLAAEFAYETYEKYARADYRSEEQFGDTMQQIVRIVAKADNIELALDIVQNLRESLYQTPSTYLSFVVDTIFMEIYIQTFDYERGLNIALSILNNPDYEALEAVQGWRYFLLNEISFLYNRLGNGEKALEHLSLAKEAIDQTSLSPAYLKKAIALNFGNRGRAYLLTGDHAQAREMGVKVLAAGEELQDTYLIAMGHRLIGTASIHLGNEDLAFEALTTAIELAEEHNIVPLQKYLFKDYALLFEKRGEFETALAWQNKQFTLAMQAQEETAAARTALSDVEFRAFEASQKVLKLQHENNHHHALAKKDGWIKSLLMAIVIFLLAGGAVLTKLIFSLRKGRVELIKSKDEAQLANKLKSDFLANMSHELRTPLNGVLGMAQVLQETELGEKQRLYLDTMHSSGQSLLAIINDILDFSKIEANKMNLHIEPTHLEDELQHVINSMIPSATEKELGLSFHYDPALPKSHMVDFDRLRQIVTNLVGNAIKFTHKGHVDIKVTGRVIDRQSFIRIEVIDTGIGIEREKFDLIFDKFTQAEGSTTRRFGGTGLGLAISRKLAEAMNGSLTVASELGVGSTFTLELPAKTVRPDSKTVKPAGKTRTATKVSAQSSDAKTQAANTNEKTTLKVLVASNDQNYRETVGTVLQHPRIDLVFVANSAAALKDGASNHVDLVLLDVPLPLETGLQTLRTINRIDGAKTPVICTLDQTLMAHKYAFASAGMDAQLQKPLQKKELAETVIFWLKASRANTVRPAA